MTSDIIQELYQVVNKHTDKEKLVAALKGILVTVEYELEMETFRAQQEVIYRSLQGGEDH